MDLVVSPVQQLPAHLLDLKAKTRSRLHYKMAELAAQPLVRTASDICALLEHALSTALVGAVTDPWPTWMGRRPADNAG